MFFYGVGFWSSKILLPLNLEFTGLLDKGLVVMNDFPVVFLYIYFCLFLDMY